MNKKILIAFVVGIITTVSFARPHGGPGPGGGYRPGGPGPGYHHGGGHHHSDSFWGRGGRNFWPSFIGAAVGASLSSPTRYETTRTVYVQPTTTVVQQPVIQPVVQPTVVQPVVTPVVNQPTTVVTPVITPVQPVVQPTTTIVAPVTHYHTVAQTKVWVPGFWQERYQNGELIKVWVPGHYESR